MIWASGPDAACNYFNQGWLAFTGRPLERELGAGWLEGVHVEDSAQCMAGYLRAFEQRAPFALEYRLRRHDGEYRWVLDVGVPRARPDGVFDGYVGCALDISDQKRTEADLRQSQRQLRALAAKLATVREEERIRIAREIHDELGQSLTRLGMDADWIATQPAPREVKAQAAAMRDLIDQLQNTVRRIAAELRPALLDTAGLPEALRWEAEEFQRRTGIACRVTLPDAPLRLAPERASALYRILQETLTNVVRHAAATRIDVRVDALRRAVELEVIDNGRGFRPPSQPMAMLGILGMQERAAQFGGEFSIGAAKAAGTRVRVRFPID
jgi:PAS domain S-box-containing protein